MTSAQVGQLRRYDRPNAYFTRLSNRLVIFEAVEPVCSGNAPFTVLNGACNEIYAPVDRPFDVLGGGDLPCLKRE